ncbi:carbohydrate ABC transporter permease [Paenibacillus sp. FSL K6-0276]|uniref:carbohydrate ABC transporter permease n=1 Tax=unclassified Paenibacillus TaxID=185978 RepID=UPI0028AAA7A9|nr:carbohydrate ABC transporter permease [Paenibacillus sp.]
MKKTALIYKWTLSAFLVVIAAVMVFPIIFTLMNSFMSENEIGRNYDLIGQVLDINLVDSNPFITLKLIPDWVTFEQYGKILFGTPTYLNMFWNSVFMVVPIILGQVLFASLAAYAFAKLRFRGRDPLFLVYVIVMLMPFQVTLVPNYIIADHLGLLNSASAIVLPGIFAAFGVFMLRQFMLSIPYSYIEAAIMDGAGHLKIFVQIILPLIKPGISALVILLFVDYWNMVEQPLIFLEDAFKQPLSLYLSRIQEEARGIGFAASVLYMSPMLLLFLYTESYFIEGVQMSGIKG